MLETALKNIAAIPAGHAAIRQCVVFSKTIDHISKRDNISRDEILEALNTPEAAADA